MKPKTKDGQKLNLYVDREVVKRLNEMSKSEKLSRSAIVERLVNTNSKSTSTGAKVLKRVSDLDDQSQK